MPTRATCRRIPSELNHSRSGRQKARELVSKGVDPHAAVKGCSQAPMDRCFTKIDPLVGSFPCSCASGVRTRFSSDNPFSILECVNLPNRIRITPKQDNFELLPDGHVLSFFQRRSIEEGAKYRRPYWEAGPTPEDTPVPILKPERLIPTKCAASGKLRRKAQKIVKLLRADQCLKAIRKLPSDFVCGTLRQKVRSIYAPELTLVQELSIKTAAKAEVQPCSFCVESQKDIIDQWKQKRRATACVDAGQLDEFGRAFAANVPDGWNKRKSPYIPNGHGTLFNTRRDGGNWNTEPPAPEARVELVHSSGKPRIVTLYSEFNVRTLTPLHTSLYASLKGREWLLVGSPTGEKLRYLSQGTEGPNWLSFDYIGATDNIKTAYVQRAVEILITKGEGLSVDELYCLRVFAELSLGGACGTGQPMGSPMSFPVLCLINKAIVDLALTDLLSEGKIGFKEWTRHRCLINGDDLLTKDTSKGELEVCIARRGGQVGMLINQEKTLRDPEYAEINSSVFKNCVRQKKTNVSSLWMKEEVSDVLGLADESAATVKGFVLVTLANTTRLARQKTKIVGNLPHSRKVALMSNRRVKTALHSKLATEEPKMTELFPIVTMPDGYDLTREEEGVAIDREVDRVRRQRRWASLPAEKRHLKDIRKNIPVVVLEKGARKGPYAILKAKKPTSRDTVLCCLARHWEWKTKETLRIGDSVVPRFSFTAHCSLNPFTADLPSLYGKSSISGFEAILKTFKDKRKGTGPTSPPRVTPRCPFSANDGFVSLSDV